jgi:dTDP-glucose 4,6-dehydratase
VIFLKQGKMIQLHGGGLAKKSFIHIRDVVQGLLRALQRGEAGTYHFTVRSDATIADIVRQMCIMMGYDYNASTQVVGERLGQDALYWLDCAKAREALGWSPQVSFTQGLQEVINWIEDHWTTIQQEPLVYIHKD